MAKVLGRGASKGDAITPGGVKANGTNSGHGRVAVRLRYLVDLTKTVDPKMSTADVVSKLIIPQTSKDRCRSASMPLYFSVKGGQPHACACRQNARGTPWDRGMGWFLAGLSPDQPSAGPQEQAGLRLQRLSGPA
jgi:hypothetical protein